MTQVIQIKRSSLTATPASLAFGELAFSEVGKELFIGTSAGTVVKIASEGFATQAYVDAAVAVEKARAEAAEASLQSAIDAEVARATAAEAATLASANSYTDSKVADLVNSAPEVLDTLAEIATALGNDPNLATTLAGQIGAVDAKVDAEVVRATAAEAALQSAIDTLESETIAALDAEEAARIAADSALQTALDAEVNARTAADAALNTRIDNLAATDVDYVPAVSGNWMTDAESVVPANVSVALDILVEGVNDAFAQIDAEVARATAAEASLNTAISNEVAARTSADAALQAQIDSLQSQTNSLTTDDILYDQNALDVLFDYRLTGPDLQDTTSNGVTKSWYATDAIDALAREVSLVYSEFRQAAGDNGQVLKSMATQASNNIVVTGGTLSGVAITNSSFDGGTF